MLSVVVNACWQEKTLVTLGNKVAQNFPALESCALAVLTHFEIRDSVSTILDGKLESLTQGRIYGPDGRTRFNDVFFQEIPAFAVPILWIKSSIRRLRPQFLSPIPLFLPFGPKCPVTHSSRPLTLQMKNGNCYSCFLRRRSSRVYSCTTAVLPFRDYKSKLLDFGSFCSSDHI